MLSLWLLVVTMVIVTIVYSVCFSVLFPSSLLISCICTDTYHTIWHTSHHTHFLSEINLVLWHQLVHILKLHLKTAYHSIIYKTKKINKRLHNYRDTIAIVTIFQLSIMIVIVVMIKIMMANIIIACFYLMRPVMVSIAGLCIIIVYLSLEKVMINGLTLIHTK